jgi:hypothetical protein
MTSLKFILTIPGNFVPPRIIIGKTLFETEYFLSND